MIRAVQSEPIDEDGAAHEGHPAPAGGGAQPVATPVRSRTPRPTGHWVDNQRRDHHSAAGELRRQLRQGTQFPLSPLLDELNATVAGDYEPHRERFDKLSGLIASLASRYLPSVLSPSEYMVYHCVADRTVGWRKYAELITYRQIQRGLRGADGELVLMQHGAPVWAGTGLDDRAIARDTTRLLDKGLITRFRLTNRNGKACAYMPFTPRFIARGAPVYTGETPQTASERYPERLAKRRAWDRLIEQVAEAGEWRDPPEECYDLTRWLSRGP